MSPALRSTPVPDNADNPWRIRAVALLLTFAALAIYANTLSAPFVFDDNFAIVENSSIRDLTAWRDVLSPPAGAAGAAGRPVVNLSLALNYAIGGLDVRGYHVANTLIHALAGLALFGLVRRTLRRPALHGQFVGVALPLASAIALLWTVHPLLTESVTCVTQRSESLGGLFLLVTLYCFVRGIDSHWPASWWTAAVVANFLGMATKEFTAVAPLLVFLYDRTFVTGTFREAWLRRWPWHCLFAAAWLPLGWLVATTHGRNATAGFGQGLGVFDYALTQCWAVPHYVALSLWPAPLVVDYGTALVTSVPNVALPAAVLAVLVGAGAWALVRRPALGFVAAWFFLILAPSSSFLPLVTQTVAEHRMYLPLAAVVTLLVLGLHAFAGVRGSFLVLAGAAALGVFAHHRNADYRSALALWRDTVAKRPDNSRAHNNLGNALRQAGDDEGALAQYELAVRLRPGFVTARTNLANALLALGRVPEALAQYDEAVRLDPRAADAWHNRGNALLRAGRADDAVRSYQSALRLGSDSAETQRGLGNALAQSGRPGDALPHFEAALRQEPASASLHSNLGNVLLALGRVTEAQTHYESALRLDPADADAHNNLGSLWLMQERPAAAIAEFCEALRLRPDFPAARANLEHGQQVLATDTPASRTQP